MSVLQCKNGRLIIFLHFLMILISSSPGKVLNVPKWQLINSYMYQNNLAHVYVVGEILKSKTTTIIKCILQNKWGKICEEEEL